MPVRFAVPVERKVYRNKGLKETLRFRGAGYPLLSPHTVLQFLSPLPLLRALPLWVRLLLQAVTNRRSSRKGAKHAKLFLSL